MKDNNKISSFADNVFTWVNRVNPYLLVIFVICAHKLAYVLTGNEEAYFPLAQQFFDPGWMPNSFVFNEWAGTRIIFQYITGFLLQFLSYEQMAFWGRLFVIVVATIPLVKLFKYFNISNVLMLIALGVYLLHPSWIGGEYIFEDYEPKSFAYIFVFISLLNLFKEKYVLSILFSAVASYFHVLVGGWFTVFILIYIMLYKRVLIHPILLGMLYLVILSPFVYFLSKNIIGGEKIINGVNIDWVYTRYRNVHHCTPYSRENWTIVLPGLIQVLITNLFLVFVMRKNRSVVADKFFWMALVVHVMHWFAVIVSILDNSCVISKYYLFRISSIGALIFYIYFFWWLREFYPKLATKANYLLFFLLFIPFLFIKTNKNIKERYLIEPDTEYLELVEYVKQNTTVNDVFIEHKDLPLSFMRLTKRESFVEYKMVPGGGEKIYEWYVRVEAQKKLKEDISYLREIEKKYKLDYLISCEPFNIEGVSLRYSNDKYFLYKIHF